MKSKQSISWVPSQPVFPILATTEGSSHGPQHRPQVYASLTKHTNFFEDVTQEVCVATECCFSRSPRTIGAKVHQEGGGAPTAVSEELSNPGDSPPPPAPPTVNNPHQPRYGDSPPLPAPPTINLYKLENGKKRGLTENYI